jgi:hypothetical protein
MGMISDLDLINRTVANHVCAQMGNYQKYEVILLRGTMLRIVRTGERWAVTQQFMTEDTSTNFLG